MVSDPGVQVGAAREVAEGLPVTTLAGPSGAGLKLWCCRDLQSDRFFLSPGFLPAKKHGGGDGATDRTWCRTRGR